MFRLGLGYYFEMWLMGVMIPVVVVGSIVCAIRYAIGVMSTRSFTKTVVFLIVVQIYLVLFWEDPVKQLDVLRRTTIPTLEFSDYCFFPFTNLMVLSAPLIRWLFHDPTTSAQ